MVRKLHLRPKLCSFSLSNPAIDPQDGHADRGYGAKDKKPKEMICVSKTTKMAERCHFRREKFDIITDKDTSFRIVTVDPNGRGS